MTCSTYLGAHGLNSHVQAAETSLHVWISRNVVDAISHDTAARSVSAGAGGQDTNLNVASLDLHIVMLDATFTVRIYQLHVDI